MAVVAAAPRLVPFDRCRTIDDGHPRRWMAILALPCAMDPWEAAGAEDTSQRHGSLVED